MKLFSRARNCLLAMLASSLLGFAPAQAAEVATEAAVRAALVFNFLKFTEWPAALDSNPHLQVCIASSDPELVSAMDTLNARKIRSKAVLVMTLRQPEGCDVIYVDSRQRWNNITEKHGKPQALTIAGYSGFVADGGMIEIALQNNGSRFDINQGEAKQAGLRFYPQLLKLARRVVE